MAVISDLTDLLTQKNIKFLLNEPMFRHTTFKIGGPADIMVIPNNKNQIIDILNACKNLDIPVTVIGNGSDPVSYTHLDVYKRQVPEYLI